LYIGTVAFSSRHRSLGSSSLLLSELFNDGSIDGPKRFPFIRHCDAAGSEFRLSLTARMGKVVTAGDHRNLKKLHRLESRRGRVVCGQV